MKIPVDKPVASYTTILIPPATIPPEPYLVVDTFDACKARKAYHDTMYKWPPVVYLDATNNRCYIPVTIMTE